MSSHLFKMELGPSFSRARLVNAFKTVYHGTAGCCYFLCIFYCLYILYSLTFFFYSSQIIYTSKTPLYGQIAHSLVTTESEILEIPHETI